jgi:hypothetical protein
MMLYYTQPFTFDFLAEQVRVDAGTYDLLVADLYTAVKEAQASEEGIIHEPIGKGSGLNDLGDGVRVGLTIELLGSWQIKFPEGNYIARIAGGNLIGGPGGDPVAYSAGVQTLIIQSAAATVVSLDGAIPTAEENAAAVRGEIGPELSSLEATTTLSLQLLQNKATREGDLLTVFDDDGTTPLVVFNLSADGRVPQ